MSQQTIMSSIPHSIQVKLINKLQISPIAKKSWNGKPSYSAPEKAVECFIKDGDFHYLPYTTCYDEFGTTNDKIAHQKTAIQKTGELRENQKDIARQVVQKLKTKRRCLLVLRPGGGKTVISCIVSTCIKLLTVVLVQNKVLLEQWQAEYEKFTDAKTWTVSKGNVIPEDTDVIICYIGRVRHIPKEIRERVGMMIVDEAPLLCNQMGVNAMLSFQPRHLLFCSATPSRSRDGMYRIMDEIHGEEIVTSKEKITYSVVRLKTQFEPIKTNSKSGRLNWPVYIQSLLYNEERNRMIVDGIAEYESLGVKQMVVTSETAHVHILHKMIEEMNIDTDWFCGTKKECRNCSVLVGNVQKCGVGFDEANFCKGYDGKRISVIWVVTEIANEELIEQVAGRGFRAEDPIIIHLMDSGNMSSSHWNMARKVHIECGGTIINHKI